MSIREERVRIEGKFAIGATITRNDAEISPAIVIVMGTGKLDRDGNGKGMNLNFYRDLADFFGSKGFVVARFDKRGTHESEGDFNSTGLNDLVDDAISVVRFVKQLPYVDENRVIVCGHSEGAMIATLMAEKEGLAGLILLGGAATSMKDGLHYQSVEVEQQSKDMKGLKGMIIRRSASLEKSEAKSARMFEKARNSGKDKSMLGPSPKWLREHESHSTEDYVSILRSFGRPVLAITGKSDLNVDYRQLDNIRDIPGISCYAPDGINHILRKVDGDNSILDIKKQYVRLSREPIDEDVLRTIGEWLGSNF